MRITVNKAALALLSSSSLVRAQDDYYYGEYASLPFDRYFDTETMTYLYVETYDDYSWYIYYESGDICYGESDYAEDGSIDGIVISDPWGMCGDFATYGWTYAETTLKEDGTLASFTGP